MKTQPKKKNNPETNNKKNPKPAFANGTLWHSLRYQQNKHAQQQYKTTDVLLSPESELCWKPSQVQCWNSASCQKSVQDVCIAYVQIEVGVKQPKAGIWKQLCYAYCSSCKINHSTMRPSIASPQPISSALVECNASRSNVLLCHDASLLYKLGPEDFIKGFSGILQRTKFLLKMKVEGCFSLLKTSSLSSYFARVYSNTAYYWLWLHTKYFGSGS